ncbi:hypothetical protein [Mesorhizobium sp. M1403]|uniref:hypothetical protein n=1 Tax=Mesorhizobium sp. M1403 TaxID=2957097 RepID=UPI0033355079
MSSILAAVREAMSAPADEIPLIGDATGAQASIETQSPPRAKETGMSGNQAPAAAGISQAEHDAAVAAAETKGHGAGMNAATARLTTALGADGVKGDAGRMSAALDLAAKSPAMSGADVAAFVVANVAASKPAGGADAAAYEQTRLAAAGLAQPGQKPAPAAGGNWAAFRAKRQPSQ